MSVLNTSQSTALAIVRARAKNEQSFAHKKAEAILMAEGIDVARLGNALAAIKEFAPIDVSFHPDRLVDSGESVVQSMHDTGRYKNQFETGISNGGVTAFSGGERDLWEKALFGGAYQEHLVEPADRPKYGALNLLNHWDGACPRFGSCYFRLNARVAERSTFAFGDSATEPDVLGSIDAFDAVLASTLEALHSTGSTLGGKKLTTKSFLEEIVRRDFTSVSACENSPGRNLDECIEVHVHGHLDLGRDVEWLAVDGAFRDTDTGEQLIKLSEKYNFGLHWNPGFFLSVADVPDDFRGPTMVPLAKHIARDGVLDVTKIGIAVVSLRTNPAIWRDWGTFDETLQYLKQMWHVLLTYGSIGSGC